MALEHTLCPIPVKKTEDSYIPHCDNLSIKVINIKVDDPQARCPNELYNKCEHNPHLYSDYARQGNEHTINTAKQNKD
jgi:hypothetical protein